MCGVSAMTDDTKFRIRPGRVRSSGAQRARPFIAQALAAAKKAGAGVSRSGRIVAGNRSRFGRGQRASIQANRFITARSRGAVIKARVVRQSARLAPLATHLNYLRREGQYADAVRPDLILLDLNLPRRDGREVLEEIKKDDELCRIPVVVLTTSSADEDILRSYQLHANAYVTKPVDFERFISVIRQIDEFFVSVVKLPPRT